MVALLRQTVAVILFILVYVDSNLPFSPTTRTGRPSSSVLLQHANNAFLHTSNRDLSRVSSRAYISPGTRRHHSYSVGSNEASEQDYINYATPTFKVGKALKLTYNC